MAALGRRELLRMAGPAIALPVVANVTVAQAKEQRLVTREEIMQAFRFFDGMELQATDLNLRYQIMIDMLFETNPAALRARLQQLIDLRKDRMVWNASTGEPYPYDPGMYDELGNRNAVQEQVARANVDAAKRLVDLFPRPKPKLRTRIAGWLMGWRFA